MKFCRGAYLLSVKTASRKQHQYVRICKVIAWRLSRVLRNAGAWIVRSPAPSITLTIFRKPTHPNAFAAVSKKPLVGLVACPSHFSRSPRHYCSGTTSSGKTRPQTLSTEAGIVRGTSASLLFTCAKNFAEVVSLPITPPPVPTPSSTAFRGSHLPNCSCLLLSTCTCPLSILEAESGPSLDRPHTHAPQSLAR
jgi:hypothetical protein